MIRTPLSTVIGGALWIPGATILGGTSKTFDQVIKSLFANSEQGFAYDPNDLSTMFQDAAGTVPVTGAGQPVGLIRDKSKGLLLGSELNPNQNFDNLNGWTAGSATTAVIENSEVKATFGGRLISSVNNWFALGGSYVVGKVYKVSFDATYVSGGDLEAGFGYQAGIVVSGNSNAGIKTRYTFTSGGAFNQAIYLLGFAATSAGSVWKIDNVSVKEVTGNHSYQTTSSMRPLLAASPQRLDYDTVDDKLITNLPAQLTGCTVIRSVPNVGTQILTGQTIPTTYNDNTDHCGLIVINRALTPNETAAITSEFNKRAGV